MNKQAALDSTTGAGLEMIMAFEINQAIKSTPTPGPTRQPRLEAEDGGSQPLDTEPVVCQQLPQLLRRDIPTTRTGANNN